MLRRETGKAAGDRLPGVAVFDEWTALTDGAASADVHLVLAGK
jgi:hypothetical protein